MGITIEKINDNEHFEYKGDVRVSGNIGQNATVIIKDGNLTVDGNVEDRANISLIQESTVSISMPGIFITNASNLSISGISTGKTLSVKGNVENGVTMSSKSADFSINGNVGNNCKFHTQSGDIQAANVGNSSTIKTMSGDVKIGNVGSNCTLKTMSGDVKAGIIESNSILKTMSGDIKVQSADSSVTLETMSGSIYEKGVKRKKEKDHQQCSTFSIGNMSFINGGRIIVNGRDITDIVNDSNTSNNNQVQEPIRYSKKF